MTRLIGRREGVKYRGRFCLFVFIFRKLPEVINKRNSTLGGFFYDFFVHEIDYFLTSEILMRVTKACNSDFNRFFAFNNFFFISTARTFPVDRRI